MCDEVQTAVAHWPSKLYGGRVGLDYPVTRTTKQKLQSIGGTQKSSLIATVKFPKAEILYLK
jgi:hypothetical protein